MGRWTQRQARRLLGGTMIAAMLCTLSAVSGLGLGASTASADDAAAFVAAINGSRSSLAGAGALAVRGDLAEVAARHAAAMADRGSIHHNEALGTAVSGWEVVGENVGVGPDVETLHQAFLDSPAHRTNVLDGRYTEVGIGIVRSGGHLWVVEVFRKPMAAPVAAPAPAPVAAASAAPAPKPVAPAAVAPAPAPVAVPAVGAVVPTPAPVKVAPAPPAVKAPVALAAVPTVDELADQSAARWGRGIAPVAVLAGSPAPRATEAGSSSMPLELPQPLVLAAAGLWAIVALLLAGQLRTTPSAATIATRHHPVLQPA